jgi:hypothetical protein
MSTSEILLNILVSTVTVVTIGGIAALVVFRKKLRALPVFQRRAPPGAQFSLQHARLTCDGGAVVKPGQACRIRFEWGIWNGARSFVLYRSRLHVQKDQDGSFPVATVPEDRPHEASYQRAINGGMERMYAWDTPGTYHVKARVKAALAGSPFTYQFEVRGRVRVVA